MKNEVCHKLYWYILHNPRLRINSVEYAEMLKDSRMLLIRNIAE